MNSMVSRERANDWLADMVAQLTDEELSQAISEAYDYNEVEKNRRGLFGQLESGVIALIAEPADDVDLKIAEDIKRDAATSVLVSIYVEVGNRYFDVDAYGKHDCANDKYSTIESLIGKQSKDTLKTLYDDYVQYQSGYGIGEATQEFCETHQDELPFKYNKAMQIDAVMESVMCEIATRYFSI
jgi:hypothetical protein